MQARASGLSKLHLCGLNPKFFPLFLALLLQFADPTGAWPVPTQLVALGLVHVLSCGVVYLLVGYGLGALLRTPPQTAMLVGRVSGAAMIVIAVILIVGRLGG